MKARTPFHPSCISYSTLGPPNHSKKYLLSQLQNKTAILLVGDKRYLKGVLLMLAAPSQEHLIIFIIVQLHLPLISTHFLQSCGN